MPDEVDLSFASEAWQRIIRVKKRVGGYEIARRHLEVCVFSSLATEMKTGDVCIQGSDDFADYREQLLSWEECRPLLAEYHIRYGGYGGIAYHHVSDNYIALFSHFIPCGVWEAVYIIEGLLKNESDIQPDTMHADTQGQSTPVFALAYLLGIKLMPRIRNLKKLKFFRPFEDVRFRHIDGLFSETIDWKLI